MYEILDFLGRPDAPLLVDADTDLRFTNYTYDSVIGKYFAQARPLAFATDFAAGSVGNALEQRITKGTVNLGESLISGAGNALSELLYGTGELKGVGDAFIRGARTGAVMSGFDNITRAAGLRGAGRDPKGTCGSPNPFVMGEGLGNGRGYRTGNNPNRTSGGSGFSLAGFVKDVLTGAVIGGLGSAAFYGVGKALRESVVGRKNGSSTVIYGSDDIAQYQYNMIENPGSLAKIKGQPAKNFYGGRYNMEILQEDRIMYRAGNTQNAYGRWFTSEPPKSVANVRIDMAVKPHWIDPETGVWTGSSYIEYVYAIKIPKGTTIYTGPVGPQGGARVGGYDIMQTFINLPKVLKGFEVVAKMALK